MSAQEDRLLEDLTAIFEKEQNPFNDTGPRGGSTIGPAFKAGTQRSETGDWKCRCANYQCQCDGPNGQKKRFNVSPAYKADYNAQYTKKYGAWRRKGKKKAA